jgi:hypothetical protein
MARPYFARSVEGAIHRPDHCFDRFRHLQLAIAKLGVLVTNVLTLGTTLLGHCIYLHNKRGHEPAR